MPTSAHSRPRLVLGFSTAALVLLGSCGVDATENGATSPTTTAVDCAPSDEGGSGTGGAVGSSDVDPACTDGPTPTTEPEQTTSTTTEPSVPDVDVEAYEDAMIDSLTNSDDLGLPIGAGEAACLGPAWVEAIGAEDLADLGVEPEDLVVGDVSDAFEELIDRPVAEDMVAAFGACGIDVEDALVAEIAAEAGLTDEQTACFADELPDGLIEEVLAISLSDGSEALDAESDLAESIADAAFTCR